MKNIHHCEPELILFRVSPERWQIGRRVARVKNVVHYEPVGPKFPNAMRGFANIKRMNGDY